MELEKVTGGPEQIQSFHCPFPTRDAVQSGASARGLTASSAAVYFGVLFPARRMLHQLLHAPETTSSWKGKGKQVLGAGRTGWLLGKLVKLGFFFFIAFLINFKKSLSHKCLKSRIKGNLIHQSAWLELMWKIISWRFIILMLRKERELCLMSSEVRSGLGPQKAAGMNS